MVPETTNDNSNPQQGNSSHHPVNVVKNDPHSEVLSPAPAPTRRLKIPPNERDSRKLFVGGLPQDITNDVFVEFFSQFGELLDCVVMFDRETGRSRGFGFVTYVDPEVSARLLSMGDSEDKNVGRLRMGDKLVEVKAAQPKPGEIRRSFQKAGMMKPAMPGSAPGNHFHATASMESTRPVNFYAPDGTVVQPIQSYYPSYDANGAYMPGIYGSHPSHGVIQHGYHLPHHPAYSPPIGPAAVPMAHTPAGGVEMGHHHPGMVPYAAPVLPHQPIPAAAATSIPSFEDPTGLSMRPLANAVPWNPPPQHQQPLFYVPVMSTPASATVIPPFAVPPPAQPPRAMPDVAINDSQQKQMFEEELEKKGQA